MLHQSGSTTLDGASYTYDSGRQPQHEDQLPERGRVARGGWPRLVSTITKLAAPDFVIFEVWAFLLPASGDFSDPQLGFLGFMDHNRSRFGISTMPRTAPEPLFRLQYQSTFHGIAMHVA